MKIAIIIKYENINNYENVQFKNVCKSEEIDLSILDCDLFKVVTINNVIKIYYANNLLEEYDYILPRTGSATRENDALLYDAMRLNKLNILNDGTCIMKLKNKFAMHLHLSSNKIDNIKSCIINDSNDLSVIDKEFTYSLILKANTGSLGYGIYLVKNKVELENLLNINFLANNKHNYIIQEFVDEYDGVDYRVFMYKNKVISSMKRMASTGDFITNYSRNQLSEEFIVDEELLLICQKVMQSINCEIAGIDLLKTKKGYIVCEVNSAPGFMGLEKTNPGLNEVKQLIIEFKNELNYEKK